MLLLSYQIPDEQREPNLTGILSGSWWQGGSSEAAGNQLLWVKLTTELLENSCASLCAACWSDRWSHLTPPQLPPPPDRHIGGSSPSQKYFIKFYYKQYILVFKYYSFTILF